MRKIIKYSFKTVLLLPILFLIKINLSLFYSPSFINKINDDELAQLAFLSNELHHNSAGENMQNLFPEGFLFINELYGLAYAECVISSGISPQSELGKKAEKEINWAITRY